MINKLIKKIGFICLGLASLALAGCFHIPDEDWLLSDGESSETGKNDEELEQAIDYVIQGIDIVSSSWNEKNEENNNEEGNDNIEEDKAINNDEEIIDNEVNEEEVGVTLAE